MMEHVRIAIGSSLGDPERDFCKEPLTQQEIDAVIYTYQEEIKKPNIDPELKKVYRESINFLKKYLVFH